MNNDPRTIMKRCEKQIGKLQHEEQQHYDAIMDIGSKIYDLCAKYDKAARQLSPQRRNWDGAARRPTAFVNSDRGPNPKARAPENFD